MQRKLVLAAALAVASSLFSATTQAATIGNGALSVDINNGNGAIGGIQLNGIEFFRRGTFVSDFMIQTGTNTSTFRYNGADGATSNITAVSSSAGTVTATGTYGANTGVGFTRLYSLLSGLNVLRLTQTYTNSTGGALTLRINDAFDPDQGNDRGTSYTTFNDVTTTATGAGTAKIATASESSGYTFLAGTLNSSAVLAAGNPFQITDGFTLNSFFDSPTDGNGTPADSGVHIGYEFTLAAGQSLTFVNDYAFGTTAASALNAFVLANPAIAATGVPLPSAFAGSIALAGLTALRRNRSR